MKIIKSKKKLALNKMTLTNLESETMEKIKGEGTVSSCLSLWGAVLASCYSCLNEPCDIIFFQEMKR